MSDKDKTGGNAFPSYLSGAPGMSLRDYFAGQVIVIMLRKWDEPAKADVDLIKQWGKSAYLVADSLLAAREGL